MSPVPEGERVFPERGGYALGWCEASFSWSKDPFVWHNGSNDVNLAHIYIQPRRMLRW